MSIRGGSIDIAGWEGEREGGRERRSSEEKEEQYEQV